MTSLKQASNKNPSIGNDFVFLHPWCLADHDDSSICSLNKKLRGLFRLTASGKGSPCQNIFTNFLRVKGSKLLAIRFGELGGSTVSYTKGFSLTELLVAVSIVGILSSIALPSYLKQVTKTHQNEAATTLSQLQQKLASYVDVFKTPPPSWKAFSDYSLVMTASGPASETGSVTTTAINLPGNNYRVRIETAGTNLYTFLAEPLNLARRKEGYNVIACLDLDNGASDIKKGPIKRSAQNLEGEEEIGARADDLVCRACMAEGNCS